MITVQTLLGGAELSSENMGARPNSFMSSVVPVTTADGSVYAGAYAENAAFNPSMSPMETAVSQLNIGGGNVGNIRRAVLVEVQNGVSSQVHSAAAVLSSTSRVQLEIC